MTTQLLQNWSFSRLLRAAAAIWAFTEASRTGDTLFWMIGGLFALQAVFNLGCCGASGCAIQPPARNVDTNAPATREVTFEEVK
jgi:hypothetical protein